MTLNTFTMLNFVPTVKCRVEMHWPKSGKETCVCHLPVCIQHKVFSLCCDFYDPRTQGMEGPGSEEVASK